MTEEPERPITDAVERIEMSFRRFRQAMDRLEEAMRNWEPPPMLQPPITAQRGGIRYPSPGDFRWIPDEPYVTPDLSRRGEEVYVEDLTPGTKVFILEGVFTVSSVDMDAVIPTVWLEELPDSPLYFELYETIHLATDPKD